MSSDVSPGGAGSTAVPGDDDPLADRLDEPAVFAPPEGWSTSTSWRRAQAEADRGGPVTAAERVVLLDGSSTPRRVLWAISGGELRAECECPGWRYHDGWCAHVAALWWRWCRGRIEVVDLDTGRRHPRPPAWLDRRGGEA